LPLAEPSIAEIRHDADALDVGRRIGLGGDADAYPDRIAAGQIMPDELLVDDGAAEGHLTARLNWNGDVRRVAFGEIPSGDDARAEGPEKAGRHHVHMDGPFGH